jgi:hypothetical protein
MSLWFGYWEVLTTYPPGKWVCRCACGALNAVERGELNENLACRRCRYHPIVTDTQQQRDEQRADQARQLTFDLGGTLHEAVAPPAQ